MQGLQSAGSLDGQHYHRHLHAPPSPPYSPATANALQQQQQQQQQQQLVDMATVLIQHGDGETANRAYFQLIDGKLHLPTIREYFKLATVKLNDIVYPSGPDGFTYTTFTQGEVLRAHGEPMTNGGRPCRLLLIKLSETIAEGENGKRRMMLHEENLGLWPLPPLEQQPTTVAELSNAVKAFLQIDHNVSWVFKYKYFGELVPILSDSSLQEALQHLRQLMSVLPDEEAAAHCKLYLSVMSEEMGPREILRARISGLLDAAVARTAATTPGGNQGAVHMMLAGDGADGNPLLLGGVQSYSYDPAAYGGMPHGMGPGMSSQLAMAAAAAAAAAAGGGAVGAHPSSQVPGSQAGHGEKPVKKESKTRHLDGRFKSEQQHLKKMSDMAKKCNEMFDGAIQGAFEILDHKKIRCKVCQHTSTAYSAYHTDCVRKHFLRHHEQLLKDRGVDINKWKKEYEMGSSRLRNKGLHDSSTGPAPGPGMAGLPMLPQLGPGPGSDSPGALGHAYSGAVQSLAHAASLGHAHSLGGPMTITTEMPAPPPPAPSAQPGSSMTGTPMSAYQSQPTPGPPVHANSLPLPQVGQPSKPDEHHHHAQIVIERHQSHPSAFAAVAGAPQMLQPLAGVPTHQISITTAGSMGTVVTTDMLPSSEALQGSTQM